MGKKTVEDIDVKNKRVLVRVDFNVPMDEDGVIQNDERIRAALPTLRYLINQQAKIILMSHLGRPKGKVVESLRLDGVAAHLSTLLEQPVAKADACIGPDVEKMIADMQYGDVLLLENIRFYPEEEKNDPAFSKALANLADVYVDDAFGTAHRAHSSNNGVGLHLPSVAGYLIKKELTALASAVIRPVRPFVAIIGGAKISDKIGVVHNMLDKADTLIIGGGMANTFLAAQGYDMKKSLVETDKIAEAGEIIAQAQKTKTQLLLPTDVVVSKSFDDPSQARMCAVSALEDGDMALDIGTATRASYSEALRDAKTIVWNGPMGVFEVDAFAAGTNAVAQAVADAPAYTIVGGGDSVSAIYKAGLADRINHISTGGGASLKFLEGAKLPGLAVLMEREDGA